MTVALRSRKGDDYLTGNMVVGEEKGAKTTAKSR